MLQNSAALCQDDSAVLMSLTPKYNVYEPLVKGYFSCLVGYMVSVKKVRDVLETLGLSYPDLVFLRADNSVYQAMLFQPKAEMVVTDNFFRNRNRELAFKKFNSAAKKALEKDVEFFATPEYSFPWESLENLLITDVLFPSIGKIWVLGCESLHKDDLEKTKNLYASAGFVFILNDPDPNQSSTKKYYDPLLYLFQAKNYNGDFVKVILVQFKTHVSGDSFNTEATSLLLGNVFYLFENGSSEIKFSAMLCSDSFVFLDTDIVKQHYKDLFIYHPQLNENVRHKDYMRYRNTIYSLTGANSDILCLNWSEGSSFYDGSDQKILEWSIGKAISGSTWHSKALRINDEQRALDNHKKGFFYTKEKYRTIYHMNYEERLFLFQCTKISAHALTASLYSPTGPSLIKSFKWDSAGDYFVEDDSNGIDIFFKNIFNKMDDMSELVDIYNKNCFDVERICKIFKFSGVGNSYEIVKNNLLQIEKISSNAILDDEVVMRKTVLNDPLNRNRDGAVFKSMRMIKKVVVDKKFPYLSSFHQGFSYAWCKSCYISNAVSFVNQVESKGVFVFADDDSNIDAIYSLISKVCKFIEIENSNFKPTIGLFYMDAEMAAINVFIPDKDKNITNSGSSYEDITGS